MPSDQNAEGPPPALPAGYPAEASALGPALFTVEPPGLQEGAFKPVFAAVLTAIPAVICIAARPLLPILIGLAWALLVTAFSVWFVRWTLRRAGTHAIAHRDGFVLVSGGAYTVWRWDDVGIVNMQDVDQRTYGLFGEVDRLLAKHYRLRHRLSERGEYSFWNTQGPGAERFGLLVERETFARRLPAAEEAIRGRAGADFAPFHISQDGLRYAGDTAPWAAIGASIHDGKLHVTGVGPRGEVSLLLEKIDNVHVFLELLGRHVRIRAGDPDAVR